MLECNKNYTTIVLKYILKNLKRTISISGIEIKNWNNNIKEE